eukprot:TRINITY_DN1936_c0_g1_i1.p1 TRINITY_DN1936_c0_g1~~TRINITY_DN1936_c0_g1_i1.p1  ORF type:complete len:177 (+),score=36.88 TRINITY_DN1936_c0_g1_i1:79-609(+)
MAITLRQVTMFALFTVSCGTSPADELAALGEDDACDTGSGEECGISLRQLRRKEKLDAVVTSGDNCAFYCQYQSTLAWPTQTACCGCGGGTCTCSCASWCQYQGSATWATQTACCGCSGSPPEFTPGGSSTAHEPVAAAKDYCITASSCDTCCNEQSSYCVQQECWMCQTDKTSAN